MDANPLDLTGRRIVVTGASSGLGRETSIALSELGARLMLVGRNAPNLDSTLKCLRGDGHTAELLDLCDAESLPRWFKSRVEAFGPFHGLAHCAGVHAAIPVPVLSARKVEETLRVNTVSAVMLSKAFRQKGCFAGPGAGIVFLSSVTALAGGSGIAAYAASKAALCGLTRALAMEFAADGIRVNCIAAGMVHSPMTERFRGALSADQFAQIEAQHPLGFGRPRDVALGVAYLLADTARWITGSTLTIDGGYTAH